MNTVKMYNIARKDFHEVSMLAITNQKLMVDAVFGNDFDMELVGTFKTELSGERACEQAFDISNNPGRREVRELIQGRTRSLSVGEVVEVESEDDDGFVTYERYICCDMGWEKE